MTAAALGLVELDDAQVDLVEEYRYLQGELKKLEERAGELKVALLSTLRDADGGTVGGALIVRRVTPSGYEKLDPKAVERRYPDVYQSCLKWVQPSPYPRLVSA